MIIRLASAEDSHGIALVHVSSWRDAYGGLVPQSYLDELSVANREQRWVEIFEQGSSETLVADAAGDIVGFICYGKSRDTHALPGVGEIYAIYVASSHWSTGVGRSLWAAALVRLRELNFAKAIVWVLAANEKAIRFYEQVGFALSIGSETTVEIGGKTLPEVRYEVAIA
jgi:L-amino acid N-acyltransferase YncA